MEVGREQAEGVDLGCDVSVKCSVFNVQDARVGFSLLSVWDKNREDEHVL